MPTNPLPTSSQSGLRPAGSELFDPRNAPVIKEPRRPTDHLMTKEQVVMIQSQASANGNAYNDAVPLSQPLNPEPTVPQPMVPPTSQPPTAPAVSAPTAPQPPVLPGDSQRVQDRINRLYGEKKTAEERVQELETRLSAMIGRFEPAQNPFNGFPSQLQPPAPPPPAAFNPFESPGGGPPQPDGQYVSRSEMAALLQAQTQQLLRVQALGAAHSASRSEAQRDFPDVFAHPQLASVYERALSRDFSGDPEGPYKAAMLARGAAFSVGGPPAQPGPQVPTSARKEGLMGVGASVPEGSGATDDRAARYQAALARARQTGREEDVVTARLIQQGLL